MSVHQKLAIILENKVVPEKNVFTKKWSPRLIFLNEFLIFGIEDFESTILALFDELQVIDGFLFL